LKDKIDLGIVDCSKQENLKKKFNIKGYPTLLIFNGQNSTEYLGELKAGAIVSEVKQYVNTPVEKESEF
jgi:thioredoxin-like negative regulator of GroEL